MTDRFEILPLKQLLKIILSHLRNKESVLGIQKELIFKPGKSNIFQLRRFNQLLETPVGVAAGPHTQMAQNIVAAWLTGARFIELKTIQTLDEIDVSKPCIDMQDEGYNCEWSQELKIQQSFDQYLNAWILIHILKHEMGFDETEPGFIFNMSAGYDYNGIMKPNVQWFLDKMNNASAELSKKTDEIKDLYPEIENIYISPQISNNITLSTMHGCPPAEIEKIALYLIKERKLNTTVKLNPTLIGKEKLHHILKNSGFRTVVPDEAFEHDLKYNDAVSIINNLTIASQKEKIFFGLKLTNTLESINNKNIFKGEKMMYMSGRALHPVSVNLALKLQNDFNGKLDISFSGGADAFNVSYLIAAGLAPVTVCTDLLKPGSYGRLKQYFSEISKNFKQKRATGITDFIVKSDNIKGLKIFEHAHNNLKRYAPATLSGTGYKKTTFSEPSIKTKRELTPFDCVQAPCVGTCPTNQEIPGYMYYTAKGEFRKAFELIMQTNPFPNTTGMVCDHVCTSKCTRINYDAPLRIREIKRFVAEHAVNSNYLPDRVKSKETKKAAIIGAGPSGLSAAWFLRKSNFEVDVYEAKPRPGGMVSGAIPKFRLTGEAVETDIDRIESAGVHIMFNTKVDKTIFNKLKKEYDFVYIAAGAQKSRKLPVEGVEHNCVIDPLEFLRKVKKGEKVVQGGRIAIIGGGNTAMDAARTCVRTNGKVTILYRRSIADMPADPDEIAAALDEGIEILEYVSPIKIEKNGNGQCSVVLIKMKAGEKETDGRAKPVPVKGSEFLLNFDTIIPALGQDIAIDFIDLKLLKTKPGSYETKSENVFIGGDALRGASTVIKAVADGRKAAEEIISKAKTDPFSKPGPEREETTLETHMLKRAARIYPQNSNVKESDHRLDFSVQERTFTEEEAMKEASRCLLCDEVCNICTTVCPNLAFHSYVTKPAVYKTATISVNKGKTVISNEGTFEIKQKYQILHIADWCNECGNCATFCPTAGKPYSDKPHLYLTKESFEKNRDGFFYENNLLAGYLDNEKYSFRELKNQYIFQSKSISVKLDKQTFKIVDMEIKEKSTFEVSLKFAAEMKVVFEGAKSFWE